MSQTLRLGTRRSELALWQANWVRDRLVELWPELTVELVEIVTKGDQILDRPLSEVGGKGLFVNGIEDRLLARDIDLAVHSMKDLPSTIPDGLQIAATPQRADPRDALVCSAALGRETLATLPAGSRVGTSSLRRSALALRANPGLEIVALRGNVPTRLRAVQDGRCDAVVLATAGLERLGRGAVITERLDPEFFCPAATQGVLAIETRVNDDEVSDRILPLDHPETGIVVATERAFLEALDGGCQVPMGCFAVLEAPRGGESGARRVRAQAVIGDPSGRPVFVVRDEAAVADAAALGTRMARRLLDAGAGAVMERLAAGSTPGA